MSEMDVEFEGPIVEWRGPAPFYFVRVPEEESADIKFAARGIEYWGQVPVVVRIHGHEFTTALFPKDGVYLLPLKVAVREAAGLGIEGTVTVSLDVGAPRTSPRPARPAAAGSYAVFPARPGGRR